MRRKENLLDEKDPGDVEGGVGGGGEEAQGGSEQVPQPAQEAGEGAKYIKKHRAANLEEAFNKSKISIK